jgi:hypothetical protein
MPKQKGKKKKRSAPPTAHSDGFGAASGSGGGRYASHPDKYKSRYNAFWKPAPNQSLQNDSVIHFTMTTRQDQMIR